MKIHQDDCNEVWYNEEQSKRSPELDCQKPTFGMFFILKNVFCCSLCLMSKTWEVFGKTFMSWLQKFQGRSSVCLFILHIFLYFGFILKETVATTELPEWPDQTELSKYWIEGFWVLIFCFVGEYSCHFCFSKQIVWLSWLIYLKFILKMTVWSDWSLTETTERKKENPITYNLNVWYKTCTRPSWWK